SFFPSRRRHTKSKRDWSSDVCSSDLPVRAKPFNKRSKSPRRCHPRHAQSLVAREKRAGHRGHVGPTVELGKAAHTASQGPPPGKICDKRHQTQHPTPLFSTWRTHTSASNITILRPRVPGECSPSPTRRSPRSEHPG